jgi:hypothetical protein
LKYSAEAEKEKEINKRDINFGVTGQLCRLKENDKVGYDSHYGRTEITEEMIASTGDMELWNNMMTWQARIG